MTVLNTIVANQLEAFKKEVDSRNQHNSNTEDHIVAVLRGYMEDVERIVFNGDGYSEAWEKEAMARGLSNNKTTPVALKAMISEKSKEVFANQHVFNENELHSRYEVLLENYINKVGIEADLLEEMSRTFVLPAANEHLNKLGETYRTLSDMGLKKKAKNEVAQVTPVADLTGRLSEDLSRLMEAKTTADSIGDAGQRAESYADQVKPLFDDVRASIDKLEGLVDDKIWPVPKYRELLFLR
jgi:glutamine synthetase